MLQLLVILTLYLVTLDLTDDQYILDLIFLFRIYKIYKEVTESENKSDISVKIISLREMFRRKVVLNRLNVHAWAGESVVLAGLHVPVCYQ